MEGLFQHTLRQPNGGNLYLQDSPERLQVAALALDNGTQDMTSDNLANKRAARTFSSQRTCGGW